MYIESMNPIKKICWGILGGRQPPAPQLAPLLHGLCLGQLPPKRVGSPTEYYGLYPALKHQTKETNLFNLSNFSHLQDPAVPHQCVLEAKFGRQPIYRLSYNEDEFIFDFQPHKFCVTKVSNNICFNMKRRPIFISGGIPFQGPK